ncbi:hypothetical protein [Streptomyces sp. CAU 1734]|uniref:hypothetical protein n=1 Tax=Streptomyces sp. CAU 1734 TaxID=3140360 RepID=UPI003260CBE6
MGYDEVELFRVVETIPEIRDGEPTGNVRRIVSGPYTVLSAARAARTREQRTTWHVNTTFTIERTLAVWTEVE